MTGVRSQTSLWTSSRGLVVIEVELVKVIFAFYFQHNEYRKEIYEIQFEHEYYLQEDDEEHDLEDDRDGYARLKVEDIQQKNKRRH